MSNLDSFSLLQCTDIGSGASVPGEKKKTKRERASTQDEHTKQGFRMGEVKFML